MSRPCQSTGIPRGIDPKNQGMADQRPWHPALFLPAKTVRSAKGRLSPMTITRIWQEICSLADVEGKTPHAARHAMGKRIMDKTGNISAVQRQLGHKNAAYSMQYARITDEELKKVLDER